ncbi:MAG: hypothetical protein JXA66_00085 [Oligoflexia bacterium]|nr:hypothetical protein [Oligoflexia bacterium]
MKLKKMGFLSALFVACIFCSNLGAAYVDANAGYDPDYEDFYKAMELRRLQQGYDQYYETQEKHHKAQMGQVDAYYSNQAKLDQQAYKAQETLLNQNNTFARQINEYAYNSSMPYLVQTASEGLQYSADQQLARDKSDERAYTKYIKDVNKYNTCLNLYSMGGISYNCMNIMATFEEAYRNNRRTNRALDTAGLMESNGQIVEAYERATYRSRIPAENFKQMMLERMSGYLQNN